MTIKTWEERAAESTEEFMDLPIEKDHHMQREINDLRVVAAKYERLEKLVVNLDTYRYCMSYNYSYFGEPPGYLKQTVREMWHLVNKPDSKVE